MNTWKCYGTLKIKQKNSSSIWQKTLIEMKEKEFQIKTKLKPQKKTIQTVNQKGRN